MSAMRILMVCEDIPYASMGGLAKHVLTLARALSAAGYQVDILGGNQHPIEVAGEEARFGGRFFGELEGHLAGWKEIGFGMFMPPRRTWVARRFARIIMRHAPRYDVIHYHGHVPNVARYIPASVNFVQTRHDHGSECIVGTRFRDGDVCVSTDPADCAHCRTDCPNAAQRTVSAIAVRRFRQEVADGFRIHKTIFVSDMLQRNFARTMGAGPWGLTVHNFINRAEIERAKSNAAPAPADGRTHVFISGKIYPAKGMECFLQELAGSMPAHMQVTIAGDGMDEARLRRQYESDRIVFVGWCSRDRTLELAAASHAIVVPSLWEEPCATTALEGLMLGKPVFALRRGGTPELAVYTADPGQLRLFPDMPALVRALIAFRPGADYPAPPHGSASSSHVVQKLLDVYALPPGAVFA
jgi:glycogen(starch) synthase